MLPFAAIQLQICTIAILAFSTIQTCELKKKKKILYYGSELSIKTTIILLAFWFAHSPVSPSPSWQDSMNGQYYWVLLIPYTWFFSSHSAPFPEENHLCNGSKEGKRLSLSAAEVRPVPDVL